MATFKEALQYAANNPTSDFARQFGLEVATGKHDQEAAQFGFDTTAIKKRYAPELQKQQTLAQAIPPKEGTKVGEFVKSLVSAPATIVARPFQLAETIGHNVGMDVKGNTAKAQELNSQAMQLAEQYKTATPEEKVRIKNEIDSLHRQVLGISSGLSANADWKPTAGGVIAEAPQNLADVKKDVGRGIQTVAFGMPGIGSAGAAFGIGSSLEQGNDLFSLQTALEGTLGAAGGKVLGLIGKPIFNVAGKVVGEITPKYIQDIVSQGTKAIEEFAAQHEILPQGVRTLTDKAGQKITKVGNVATEAIKEELKPITSKVKGVFSPNFETSANKAFPVLKKDVVNIETRNENIKNAFTDIAKNKESIGLTDNKGNFRTPKTFTETLEAQNKRLPEIYKEYTNKLSTVDRTKFDSDISNGIQNQVSTIDAKLAKENSIDNRKALNKIKFELQNLKDTSPEGIQNYLQTINQKIKPLVPGGSLTQEQIQYANLAGDLRKVLDDSIEKVGGQGYQDLRNIYASHKAIQSQLLNAVKKEMNATPGFTEKLGDVGLSVEGINYLLTHDPQTLVIGTGIKGTTKLLSWLKSPQRALQNMFSEVENQITPSLLKPQAINTTATIEPSTVIPKSSPKSAPKSSLKGKGEIPETNYKQYSPELRSKIEKEILADDTKAIVIDTDTIKKLHPKYNPKNPMALHEESSALSKKIFEKAVKQDKSGIVKFIGGGAGSGKSEVILTKISDKPAVVFDGTLANFDSAVKKIDYALSQGKKVEIYPVYTPIELATLFNKMRVRNVSDGVLLDTHFGMRNTIPELITKYGNKIKVIPYKNKVFDPTRKYVGEKSKLSIIKQMKTSKEDLKRANQDINNLIESNGIEFVKSIINDIMQ